MTKTQQEYRMFEAMVAISGEFHSNRSRYQKFYDRHCDDVGGFPGVWRVLIDAIRVFEFTSDFYGVAGEDFDWIGATEGFATILQEADSLTAKDYARMAHEALKKTVYAKKGGKRGKKEVKVG
jgi:hypothetical protein